MKKTTGCSADNSGRRWRLLHLHIVVACLVAWIHAGPAAGVCGDGVADPEERCDDGGVCAGGARAGTACTSETECVDGGACFGGLDDLRACDSHEQCRLGECRRCRPLGGDGCAANCTAESEVRVDLVGGSPEPGRDPQIVLGTSGAVVFGAYLTVPLPMAGTAALTVGEPTTGVVPVVIKAGSIDLPTQMLGNLCFCIRMMPHATCGGTLLEADGTPSADCTPGSSAVQCPADKPCAAIHGSRNAGSGFVTCGSSVDVEVTQDCNGEPFEPPFEAMLSVVAGDRTPSITEGGALLAVSAAVDFGTASGGRPGEPCTCDDPEFRGGTRSLLLTTGSAVATILNPGDFQGDISGPFGARGRNAPDGRPFVCRADGEAIDLRSGIIGGVFSECERRTFGDTIVVMSLALSPPSSPTPSATPTSPTATPTRTTTRTWTPTPGVAVLAGDVEVGCDPPAGTRFAVDFSLVGNGVAGVQHDFLFASTILDIDVASCRINPAIGLHPLGQETAPSCLEDNTIGPCKSLAILEKTCGTTPPADGCPAGAGSNINVVTVLIAGTASLNNSAIPEGPLFSCEGEVEISGGLPATIVLSRVVASDSAGRRLHVRAGNGNVGGSCPPSSPTPPAVPSVSPTLTPSLSPTAAPSLSPTAAPSLSPTAAPSSPTPRRRGSGGCSMRGAGEADGDALFLIAGLAMLAVGRIGTFPLSVVGDRR